MIQLYGWGQGTGFYEWNTSTNVIGSVDYLSCLNGLNISSFEALGDSILWVSTNNGLYRVNLKDKYCRTFVGSHGLVENQFNVGASIKLPNGEIWWGSKNGITVLDTKKEIVDVPAGKVNIGDIMINNVDPLKTKYPKENRKQNELLLAHEDNTLSFRFSALDYRGVAKAEYEYRLLPIEKQWVKSGNRGFARYANLEASSYEFQVRAVGHSINRNENYGEVTKFAFGIVPPFYATTWFQFIILSILLIFIYSIVTIYQRRKRSLLALQYEKRLALEQERVRIAHDLHDDLGSGLSALSLRAQFLADMGESNSQSELLQQLAGSAKKLTQQVRDAIWTVNAENDSVDQVITKMHQYAEEYFMGSETMCEVRLPSKSIGNNLQGFQRRDLMLVFKEALHNIEKHASAKNVNIEIKVEDESLLISIQDDGKGFDVRTTQNGLGIRSMIQRMNDIGGIIKIHSDDSGTTIFISMPMG